MHAESDLPAIVTTLPVHTYNRICYRIVDLAALTGLFMPLYTLGAGSNGQRYTPKNGPNALYVAEDIVTAQAEYNQVARITLAADPNHQIVTNPTVQLAIQVNLERILDLTNPAIQKTLGTTADELNGPWRKQMIKNTFCPTHVLATAVYKQGKIQAMRYPSARGQEFSNLIIWEERVQLPSFVQVKDSTGILSARIPPKRAYGKREQ